MCLPLIEHRSHKLWPVTFQKNSEYIILNTHCVLSVMLLNTEVMYIPSRCSVFVWVHIYSVGRVNCCVCWFSSWMARLSNTGRCKKHFSVLYIVRTGCRVHPSFYSMGTGFLSRSYIGRGVNLTTHLLPPPKNAWRYNSAPLYAFVTWTRTVLSVFSFTFGELIPFRQARIC